jgi:hypothetical protein
VIDKLLSSCLTPEGIGPTRPYLLVSSGTGLDTVVNRWTRIDDVKWIKIWLSLNNVWCWRLQCWLTSTSLQVWNLDSTSQSAVFSPYKANGDSTDPHLGHTPAFPATEEYKVKAKDIIKKMRAGGGKSCASRPHCRRKIKMVIPAQALLCSLNHTHIWQAHLI